MSKVYDPAYKLEVCQTIDSGTATVSEIHRETGISENTLYIWLKRYRQNRVKPFVGSGNVLPENEELVRLRRENKNLREEVEILKRSVKAFRRMPCLHSRKTKGRTVQVHQGCVRRKRAKSSEAVRGAECDEKRVLRMGWTP